MSPQRGADILKRMRPVLREIRHEMCLRPDLVEKHEQLEGELLELSAKAGGDRLASGYNEAQRAKAQEIVDLEAEIQECCAWFTFRQLERPAWQAILDNNPPRLEHQLDLFAGYNRDGVLDTAIHDCLVDPVFDDCEVQGCTHDECGSYQQWAKHTPPSEWAALRNLVNEINGGVTESPKSELASLILATPAPASGRPAAGE